jgi:hypothetical protein
VLIDKNKILIFGGRNHASRRGGVATGIKQEIYDDVYIFSTDSLVFERAFIHGRIEKRKACTFLLYQDEKTKERCKKKKRKEEEN